MNYADLLRSYIKGSRLTLEEISEELNKRGLSASLQYISRLQNGKNPPASEELNLALAEITGGDPDELLVAAYYDKAPDKIKNMIKLSKNDHNEKHENKTTEDQLHAFSFRLKKGLEEKEITFEDAADKCDVTEEYIIKLLDKPNRLPGVTTLYTLAGMIGVTPDYLGGFTDDPNGHDSRTPRPKDMREFLDREEVMFEGKILSEEDKEKINNVLSAIFMDAKTKNKRK